jgi:hypothetical protein
MNRYVEHDRYMFIMFEYFLDHKIDDLYTMHVYYSEVDCGIDEILVEILIVNDTIMEVDNI